MWEVISWESSSSLEGRVWSINGLSTRTSRKFFAFTLLSLSRISSFLFLSRIKELQNFLMGCSSRISASFFSSRIKELQNFLHGMFSSRIKELQKSQPAKFLNSLILEKRKDSLEWEKEKSRIEELQKSQPAKFLNS